MCVAPRIKGDLLLWRFALATAVTVTKTNNSEIDGLLSGYKWSGAITYSFPDAPSDYANPYSGGNSETTRSGFASVPSQIQAAINYAMGLILGYTNADIQYAGTNGADLMIAQSSAANPTAYAYYPGNYASGGDIWFGNQYNFSLAKLGNYYFTTALHELGHALGLKHSQDAGGPGNVAVPSAHDSSEYTVMSYRSYVGASTTGGYTNEAYGYSQTYMANDILALQTMYGADYTTQSGNTVYTWNATTGQQFINGVGQLAPGDGVGGSANRIYETIWDGGGVDTYDLSNYTTNLSINLNPGASSLFSSVQLAYLGNGHYASGNVYNAYLCNGDARSYVDNAIGGSGNDTIIGNAIANVLSGGGGNDTITGGAGNDTINGSSGTDTALYSGIRANYTVSYNGTTQAFTIVDQRFGSPDGADTVTGVENFHFADVQISSGTLAAQVTPDREVVVYDVQNDQAWTYQVFGYDAEDRLNHLSVKKDDGTSTLTDYNSSQMHNFKMAVSQYDSEDHLTSVSIYPNNGANHSLLVTTYDPQHVQSWKEAISGYSVAGQIEYVTVEKYDGTSAYTKYSGGDVTVYNYAADGHLVSIAHAGAIVYV